MLQFPHEELFFVSNFCLSNRTNQFFKK